MKPIIREPAPMDKQSFAAFILQKRKEAGLTQEELARRLFVTNSTVSKWERGLSYPDISLVPSVCRELNITEHEFFTACDDIQGHKEKKEARSWRRMRLGWQLFFLIGYGLTLLICFICNLAISHRLDWFFIVLCSLGLAFCFTSLPLLLRRERAAVSLLSASVCLLLLLIACGAYTGGTWLGQSLAILTVCLALPWGLFALWRFYGRHLPEFSLLLATGWTVGLLAVINGVTGGDWFVSLALPIAVFCWAFVWAIFAVIRWLPVNGCLKAAAATAIAALAIPGGVTLGARLSGEPYSLSFAAYFDWSHGLLYGTGDIVYGDRAAFAVCLAAAAILLIVGIVQAVRRQRRTHASQDSFQEKPPENTRG